jgi:TonB family protein
LRKSSVNFENNERSRPLFGIKFWKNIPRRKNMRIRRSVLIALFVIGSAGSFDASLSIAGPSAQAPAAALPEALNSVPSDYQFVLGIDVRKLAASSFYAGFRAAQSQGGQIESEIAAFTAETGIDPARDLSGLILATRSGASDKTESLVIVSGQFDPARITSYIRSKSNPIEMEYGSASILMFPEQKEKGIKGGITFIGNREIALGTMESLEGALDTVSGKRNSILSNAGMKSLFDSVNFNATLWFAGNATSVLKKSPLPQGLGPNPASIQNIFGSLNLNADVSGKITATAIDLDSAGKLADVFRGLIAWIQLSADKNPEAKSMLNRIAVTQDATRVSLSFTIPGDLIKKLSNAKKPPAGSSGSPSPSKPKSGGASGPVPASPDGAFTPKTPGVKSPVVLFNPVPWYTDEARNAKIQGVVLLQLVVRKNGTTDNFKVIRGLGYGLDESAISTIRDKWRFQPGSYNGTPVDVMVNVEVSYKLYDRPPKTSPAPVK